MFIDRATIERMDGLVTIREMQKFEDSISILADELLIEGFDAEEVVEYFNRKLRQFVSEVNFG